MIKDRLDADGRASCSCRSAPRASSAASIDLLQMKALVWDDGMGEEYETVDIPADMLDRRRDVAPRARRRRLASTTRTCSRSTSATRRSPPTTSARRLRHATIAGEHRARSSAAPRSRTRASSRCSTRSSTTCRARSTCRRSTGTDVKGDEELERQRRRRRAVRGAGVQDHERPLRRQAHLLPRLLGHARARARRCSTRPRTARSASAASCRCTPTTARTRTRSSPATSSPAVGLKNTTTGDTLCDPAHPIVLERMEFPEPVIHVAIEPKTKVDQDKLGKALGALSEEDPTFQVRTDDETGQTDHLRHGRAAPRGARRPHAARVQRRRQRRQAAGRLPRDDHQAGREGRGALHPPDRWLAASTATSSSASSPPAPAAATSSSTRSPAA